MKGIGKSLFLVSCAALGAGAALAIIKKKKNKSKGSISININDEKQKIDGFGVSQAAWSNAIYDLKEPERTEVIDLLFNQDEGIGLDIFRGHISSEFSTSKEEYDFTKAYDQAWVMQAAKERGVSKFIATTWSPPAWMKDNNETTYGGFLKKEYYEEYAKYMANFVKSYKELYDIDMYAVSMCNEPNSRKFLSWDSCEWTGEQIKEFLPNYLKPTFKEEGLGYVKLISAEPSMWSERKMRPSLKDPKASKVIDIVAAHNYEIPIINKKLKAHPFNYAKEAGKSVWMTEVSYTRGYDPTMSSALKFAKEMQEFMTHVEANAYLYWTGAIPGDNDEGLINVDIKESTYKCTKRYYGFGNFSKFIKPGYIRVSAPSKPLPNVCLSAYKNPLNSKMVIIVVNDGEEEKELNLNLLNFETLILESYITDKTRNLEKVEPVILEDGIFNIKIEPRSITTYIADKIKA